MIARGRSRLLIASGGSWLLAAASASAHTTIPGAGPIINGFLHPFTVPAHLMLMLAVSLLIAQPRPFRPGLPMAAVGLAGGLGLLCGWREILSLPPYALALGTLIIALCVICALRMPGWMRALLAGGAIFLIGLDSRPDAQADPVAHIMLLGTAIALLTVVNALAYYLSLLPHKLWAQVGLRVLASWLAAASLMLLALSFRR